MTKPIQQTISGVRREDKRLAKSMIRRAVKLEQEAQDLGALAQRLLQVSGTLRQEAAGLRVEADRIRRSLTPNPESED